MKLLNPLNLLNALRNAAFPLLILVVITANSGATARADTFNFVGITTGGNSVNGTAEVTGSAGSNILTITLTNNVTNIVTVGQAISGFSFQVCDANGTVLNISPVLITAQSARLVTFSGSQTGSDVGGSNAPDTLHWGVSNNNPGYINALGFSGAGNPPDETILGAPSSTTATTATYSSANGSISNSGSHQPFAVQSATFTVTLGIELPEGFQICNVQMYFNTSPDTLTDVPEPASMLLLGSGLVGLAGGLRRLRKKQTSAS